MNMQEELRQAREAFVKANGTEPHEIVTDIHTYSEYVRQHGSATYCGIPLVADPTRPRFVALSPSQTQYRLTPREREVAGCLVRGLSNKLIADALKISDHTAKFHVNSLMQKLNVTTRTEVAVTALKANLV